MIGTWPRSRAALVAALALAAVLPGCDGGSDTPNTPPVTQPPGPVRTLRAEGNFHLVGLGEASGRGDLVDYVRHEFTTSGTGYARNPRGLDVREQPDGHRGGAGGLLFAQIDAALAGNTAACPEVGGALATSKPARVQTEILPPGTYTLVILNVNDHTESGNYQVYQVFIR